MSSNCYIGGIEAITGKGAGIRIGAGTGGITTSVSLLIIIGAT